MAECRHRSSCGGEYNAAPSSFRRACILNVSERISVSSTSSLRARIWTLSRDLSADFVSAILKSGGRFRILDNFKQNLYSCERASSEPDADDAEEVEEVGEVGKIARAHMGKAEKRDGEFVRQG